MTQPLSPEAAAWLRQSAAFGCVTSQVLEHLLERVQALDRDDDAPTPEPAPPAALSDALISAESALSDIAEGEETNAAPNTFEWAEQRCAEALAIIRPVMQQHKICTSEWPPAAQEVTAWLDLVGNKKRWRQQSPASQPAPPAAPAGGLVERVAAAMHSNYPRAFRGEARAAIREVAAWLDLVGNKGSAAELRRDADR